MIFDLFKCLFYVILSFNLIPPISAQNFPVLVDGGSASISLLNYNVSDPDGESVEYFYTILSESSVTVSVTNIPGDAYFVILQAHTYFENVTLSYDLKSNRSNSVLGSNVGLWKSVVSKSVQFYLSYPSKSAGGNTTLMLAVQAYGNKAPTPGGCNMELPVETAPYLLTTFDSDTVQVQFAPAAPPMTVMTWLGIQADHSCSLKPAPVVHQVYRYYLPERDFSTDLYFSALQNLMTIKRIKNKAHLIPTKEGAPPMRRVFSAYPGAGSSFVVVASTLTSSAVYVPTFSYACAVGDEGDTCNVLTTTFSKVFCATTLFLGLFAAFLSHRFFKLETLLFGFLAGGLIFYSALTNIPGVTDVLLYSVIGGILVGIVFVFIWCCFSSPLISVCLATSTLGYLVAAIIFFPILDYFNAFVSDYNYWIPYGCVIFLVCLLLTPLAEKANILSACVLGGFAAIVPIDYYLGSNLRFILINSIRRATVPGFNFAIIDPPYQTYDLFLTALWAFLVIAGYATQMILSRKRPPYPPPTNCCSRLSRRLQGPRVLSERTPLIAPT